MKKVTIQLEELVCPMCVNKVETALKNVKGVEKVSVLFNASKAKVEYDETIASTDEMILAVTKAGYEVLKIA